ncbi:Arsenical resistance operon repressor [Alloactinosynnema sp. L-07]|uniref:ArsR/SmtB family transcription factor n=1 Tax=Alloactinosynnema sp. L-07 TaxID=1653480 RepID=UPI00065EF201|nr:metalloregulator ArsR/SmtB family transcription factor [Alloactinosynnema sp. L-07]CRK55130.1 Arsenical resistance operon repressor [Alloactinosynnema sp. L-07]
MSEDVTIATRQRRTKAPGDADCGTDPLCCVPLGDAGFTEADAERVANVLKAMGDPARVRVLALIRGALSGEVCVGELVEPLGLSQPTVSHHLRVMTEAGLLRRERRGSWAWYSINADRLAEIRTLLA